MSVNENCDNIQPKIKNMVICSTLNQITNYLMIKKYKPERVFNITFLKDERFNINVKPSNWDKYLRQEVDKLKVKDSDGNVNNIIIKDIPIRQGDLYSLSDIECVIKNGLREFFITKYEPIYWHITGGQRILSLAMCNIARDRKKDIVLYMEGNTEQLIKFNNNLECVDIKYKGIEKYGDDALTIDTAMRLVGFKSNECSKEIFIEGSRYMFDKKDIEYRFYSKMINLCRKDKEFIKNIVKTNSGNMDYLREYFKEFNYIFDGSSKDADIRKKLIKEYLCQYIEDCKETNEPISKEGYISSEDCKKYINNDTSEEFNQGFPAGYIFEKIMAYSVYKILQTNKNNIIAMESSFKTKYIDKEGSQKDGNPIDELDIILLTNTGKIINLECKSGYMDANNAKSHNYTTYRLSGVFGMPMLMTPLYEEEIKLISNYVKNNVDIKNEQNIKELGLLKALEDESNRVCANVRAAKRAELDVCGIDGVESCLGKLNIINI